MLISARCPICRRAGSTPCAECRELFEPIGELPPPPGLDGLFAATWYREAARPLVAGLKYRDQRGSVPFVAGLMVQAVGGCLIGATVTWAPTTPARRRARGFDHGELLARAVSRRSALRCRALLTRSAGAPQTGRSAADRRRDPPDFGLRSRRVPAVVVVVDDVVTTGATLSAAARSLRLGGAQRVIGLVAGATPPPSHPG